MLGLHCAVVSELLIDKLGGLNSREAEIWLEMSVPPPPQVNLTITSTLIEHPLRK